VDKKNSRFHGLTGELTRPGILIVVRAAVFARIIIKVRVSG
jgi:hypothetical protein